jgi:hypothetical protein
MRSTLAARMLPGGLNAGAMAPSCLRSLQPCNGPPHRATLPCCPATAPAPAEDAPLRRRAPPRRPELPPKTLASLTSRALAAALADLKRQLAPGSLVSRAQARVGGCLPAVAGAIASIVG